MARTMLLIIAALSVSLPAAAQNVEFDTRTEVHAKQELGGFVPGTYRWVKVGLVASAAAAPSEEAATRLGQIAMDKLVKKANLGPNQLLVNVTVERGKAYLDSDDVAIVTIRADVIEIGTPPTASATPKWGEPIAPPAPKADGKGSKAKKGGKK